MPEDELAAKIAGHRETAEALRGIAEQLRFDPRRGNQLRALADGFERYALLLETCFKDGHRGGLIRPVGDPKRRGQVGIGVGLHACCSAAHLQPGQLDLRRAAAGAEGEL